MSDTLINTDGLNTVLNAMADGMVRLRTDLDAHGERFVTAESELAALEQRPLAKRGAGLLVCAHDSAQTLRDQADLVCPGADDQVALNQALSLLPEGGGTLHLAEGEYYFPEPLRIQSDSVRLLGAGTGSSSTNPGQKGRATYVTGQITVEHASGRRPCYGVEIADLTVDSSAGYGLSVWANNAYVHHCHVHNAALSGIRVYGLDGVDGAKPFHPYNTLVENCIITRCKADGLLWDTNAADQHADGNTIYDNGQAGIRVRAGGGQIRGGQVYNNRNNLVLQGGSPTMAQYVKWENSLEVCILIDARERGVSGLTITDCTFRNNCKTIPAPPLPTGWLGYPVIGGIGNKSVDNALISVNRFTSQKEDVGGILPSLAIDLWGANCNYWRVEGNLLGRPYPEHFTSLTPIRNRSTNSLVQAI